MFSGEFCEIFKNTFFYRTPSDDCFWWYLVTVSQYRLNDDFIFMTGGAGSSRSQLFFKICALKNFSNFTGKHLCCGLFLTGNLVLHIVWTFCNKSPFVKIVKSIFTQYFYVNDSHNQWNVNHRTILSNESSLKLCLMIRDIRMVSIFLWSHKKLRLASKHEALEAFLNHVR